MSDAARTRVVVTGGAGFIGSALVRHLFDETDWDILTIDLLTYAGRLENLEPVLDHPRHTFLKADIADQAEIRRTFLSYKPDVIFHLAAESHVDRSIDDASAFIRTNVQGTFSLLKAALELWRGSPDAARQRFRFVHVSTDEVYGSLEPGQFFSETSSYQPNSPYAASKAAADMLVRSWFMTYGLPVLITNCSNNYGPRQFPEKLIPLAVLNLAEGRPVPVYGDGLQIRDWLHVEDHVSALMAIANRGRPGQTYCIGGEAETTNMDLVLRLCTIFDVLKPDAACHPHSGLIRHVKDRPGHDRRYATDIAKLRTEIGWAPAHRLDQGLESTVQWYLQNRTWCDAVGVPDARDRRGLGGAVAAPAMTG